MSKESLKISVHLIAIIGIMIIVYGSLSKDAWLMVGGSILCATDIVMTAVVGFIGGIVWMYCGHLLKCKECKSRSVKKCRPSGKPLK